MGRNYGTNVYRKASLIKKRQTKRPKITKTSLCQCANTFIQTETLPYEATLRDKLFK